MAIVLFGSVLSWYWKYYQDLGPSCFSALILLSSVIHKSGDAADPNNYRGITITSSVGKVFNSILNERLDSFLKQNNIIDDCQIGICHETDRN
jgi:hypothetical protein